MYEDDEIDPLWEARRRDMKRANRLGCLPEIAGAALFILIVWAILGLGR